jgi:acetylornithine deacetylase
MNPVAELLAELVEADSTNPTLSEGGAGEAQVARILAQRLERAGLEVDVWDAAPGRPNVVGRLRGTGEGRTLMFCGHTDVVDAEPSQFAPVARDGRMHGRGTNDMKGGIAASVIVAERLAAGPRLAGDVLMAFVIDEEWASLGAEALIGRYQADGAVLPEQSDLDVVIAHGGFAWYEVTSLGVESAGGEPEKGIDGIALAGPLLTGIVELDRELEGRVASLPYPNDGRPNIHASTIRGGQTYPTYPAQCVIQIERCIMPGESLAESYAELEALLERARTADPRFRGSSTTAIAREPVMLDRDEPVVQAMIGAVSETTGEAPVVRSDYGWMDSGVLVEAGIPCVVYGPLGEGVHTADEWVDLASLDTCVDVFERFARTFCG